MPTCIDKSTPIQECLSEPGISRVLRRELDARNGYGRIPSPFRVPSISNSEKLYFTITNEFNKQPMGCHNTRRSPKMWRDGTPVWPRTGTIQNWELLTVPTETFEIGQCNCYKRLSWRFSVLLICQHHYKVQEKENNWFSRKKEGEKKQ